MTTSDAISTASLVVAFFSLLVAVGSLVIVLYDRRTMLLCRAREGEWMEVGRTVGGENLLRGVVEVYNRSTRPNVITSYRYFGHTSSDDWVALESERYTIGTDIHNASPLTIPPYSGVEVRVACFIPAQQLPEITEVKAVIVDVHGHAFSFIVWARNQKRLTNSVQ